MTSDDAIIEIKNLIPDSKLGMAEKDNGFEVWAKTGHSAVGYAFGQTLDVAFSNLYGYVIKKLSESDPGDD